MNKLKQLATNHPLIFVFLAILLLLVLMGGSAGATAVLLGYGMTDVEPQVIGQIVATIGFLLLLWRLGWLAPAGVTRLGSRRLWLTTVLILAYTGVCALFAFFGTLAVDLSVDGSTVPNLVHTTLAGVMEEILFRGLILYVLVVGWGGTRRGIIGAALVSAFLFGVLHFFNLLGGPADVTTLQVTEAFLSGILYGALVVAGGSVWPAVALHSLVNLLVNVAAANVPGFSVTVGQYLVFTLLGIPPALYGFYLLGGVDLRPGRVAELTPVETAAAAP